MTIRRFIALFLAIGLGALALAAAGQWWLAWPAPVVRTCLGIGAGYAIGALVMRLMPRWWREHCDDLATQPANRRYMRAALFFLIGYALLLAMSLVLIRHGIAWMPLRALVAVLPALPLLLLMRAALRYLREIDELQRRIETEAIGAASLLLSLLYFAGGLLEKAEVFAFDAAATMIWVFPLLMLFYGIAKMLLTRRYL